MPHPISKHILCAVRGQPESRDTATRAIDLALEHKARLTFLLIIDARFLAQATPAMSPLRIVYQQLEQMGEFSMLILRDRAQRRGVEQVDYIIRKGNIPEQVRDTAIETGPEMLVLGRPMASKGHSVFTLEGFDAFVTELEGETSIRIVHVQHQE